MTPIIAPELEATISASVLVQSIVLPAPRGVLGRSAHTAIVTRAALMPTDQRQLGFPVASSENVTKRRPHGGSSVMILSAHPGPPARHLVHTA